MPAASPSIRRCSPGSAGATSAPRTWAGACRASPASRARRRPSSSRPRPVASGRRPTRARPSGRCSTTTRACRWVSWRSRRPTRCRCGPAQARKTPVTRSHRAAASSSRPTRFHVSPPSVEKSGAIGRIVVHPTNPNIVYVAALGQAWSANPERGLYKTTDGGQTWQLVKFISPQAGFIDGAMYPSNPEVLFAASWQRVRGPYFLNSGGPGSALWKTTDGGKTWTEVKGGGLPETTKGRIGIAIAASNPKVVYLMVEADTNKNAQGGAGKAAQTRPSGLY